MEKKIRRKAVNVILYQKFLFMKFHKVTYYIIQQDFFNSAVKYSLQKAFCRRFEILPSGGYSMNGNVIHEKKTKKG